MHTALRRGRLLPVLILAAAFTTTGCTLPMYRPGHGSIEIMDRREFRGYAETVFRTQNEAADILMYALPILETDDPEVYARAVKQENRLLAACAELNQAAIDQMNREGLGFFDMLTLPMDTTGCDRATQRAQRFIAQHDLERFTW